MTISAFGDGLDVLRPDLTTDEEIAAFREYYQRVKGGTLAAHEFLLEFRPDVLKRHRLLAREVTAPENEAYPIPHTLAHLHLYAVVGFGEGVLYEARQARAGGARRTDVIDTLAVAQLHAGPRGFAAVAEHVTAFVRDWHDVDAAEKDRFPAHWNFDPDAFASGLDFTSAEMLAGELERLESWHRAFLTEVPAYVRFLGRHRPRVLKAHRNRYEHAIRDSLPRQMMPYLLLHLAVSLRSEPGIRENVLLARAVGMTYAEVIDVVAWAIFYGGPDAVSLVENAVGDVLDEMAIG